MSVPSEVFGNIAFKPLILFVYTPKDGSWLKMAECEFSVFKSAMFGEKITGYANCDDTSRGLG
jgi:hypothetical protein